MPYNLGQAIPPSQLCTPHALLQSPYRLQSSAACEVTRFFSLEIGREACDKAM
jgi:hypothetical protein